MADARVATHPALEDLLGDEWPFPFSRADWDACPTAVQAYLVVAHKGLVEFGELRARVDQLEARLNQNSRNSSRPPSSDSPYEKPKPTRKRRRKAGAKKGHKGHRQKLLEPTETVDVHPERCSCGCTNFKNVEDYDIHQHIELPEIKLDVTHHLLKKGNCVDCGKVVKAQRSQIVTMQQTGFGPRFTSFVCLLAGVVGVSRLDIKMLLDSAFGAHACLGAIQKMIDRGSKAIKPHYEAIGEIAHAAEVNYIDETSWRCKAVLMWLWVMTNRTVTYFKILPGRSKDDFLELIGIWEGILVSDDYGVYRKWVNLKQACLAHLIRKAQKLAESKDEEIAHFGQRLKRELQLMCK